MTCPVFFDWESRSTVDIKKHGGWRYAQDPSSEILCGVALVPREDSTADVYAWSPFPKVSARPWQASAKRLESLGFAPEDFRHHLTLGTEEPPAEVLDVLATGRPLVAHNADDFDRVVWDELGLPKVAWVDSLNLVRRRGLPGGLEKLGQQLYGIGKDVEGHRTMMQSCKPGKKGRFLDPDGARLRSVIHYCLQDVLLLAAVWYDEDLGAPHPDDAVLRAHRAINRRGVAVDTSRAQQIIDTDDAQVSEIIAAAGVNKKVITSPPQLSAWLAERGIEVADCKRSTVEGLLASGVAGDVRRVLEARLANSRVTGSKAQAVIDRELRDGRMRGVLAYWGAHTGRWSGRGFQPQNLPRGVARPDDVPVDIWDTPGNAPAIAERIEESLADVLGSLLRGVIWAPTGKVLGIVDYSQVEARGLCWLAGDDDGLDVYRAYDVGGPDPYKVMGVRMFGVPVERITKGQRSAAKVAVLGAGYGAGPDTLQAFADGLGVRFEDADTTAAAIVEGWRNANPRIAGADTLRRWRTPDYTDPKTGEAREGHVVTIRADGLWQAFRDESRAVVREFKAEGFAGRCALFMRDGHLIIRLPSGRDLVYRDARYEEVPDRWGGVQNQVTYLHAGRSARVPTFGQRLVENAAQAITRDLLAAALVRLEDAGYRTVLHVHDEIVCELDDETQLPAMVALMCEVPEWAEGFPLAADGHCSRRYGKD